MAKPSIVNHLRNFYARHQPALIGTFLGIFFLIIFVISVSGGLRVFFPYISQLTGFPFGHKKYIVIFQNNNELRPAGGFISSFATVDFTSGFLSNLKIEDVYGEIDQHDFQNPPYPMQKLLADKWYKGYTFRDGNYSPNFPDSANELIRLYHLTRPTEQIDGVIAVNFHVLENVLETLGPVKVEDKYLSKDNLFEELTSQVNDIDRHNLESLANRKSILKPFSNAIIQKTLLNPFKIRKIADTITNALTKKDLQLYFTDSSLQTLARKNRWSGEWPIPNIPSPSSTTKQSLARLVDYDFLALVEANLGGMKSDRYLSRNVTYHVRFDEDYFRAQATPQAELKVELNHFGIENIPLSGPYTGYFRIYNQPIQVNSALSILQPTTSTPDQPTAGPVADEIIKLQPGESKSIKKTYSLSRTILKDNLYTLYIPKQSGTKDDNYTVIIELPRGYRTESDDFDTKENLAFFQGPLNKDLQLQLKVIPDSSPPRIILQDNTELNKISLHFNEDLNQDYANDPFSYKVTDLNLKHPETTDKINLKKVVTTSKDIDLFLTGQTNQTEEHFGVQLRNLRDQHGNILSDRQITVVQRLN